MADVPALPVTGPTPRLRARVRARVMPWRVIAIGLTALSGLAWLTVLRLDWNPSLALIAAAVATSGTLIPLRARWAQALVRAALWGSFVCGLALSLAGHGRSEMGALLALPSGGALLLLSRLGRRLRGREPMLFVATVLAIADIGAHSMITVFALREVVRDPDLLFFPAIAGANLVGLLLLRWLRTPWPHVVLNALVVMGALLDVADVKGFVNVVVAGCALLQMAAAFMAVRPPPSPATRRAALRWLRALLVLGMLIALAAGGLTALR